MTKLTENSDEIIFRHIPIFSWGIGVFSIVTAIIFVFGLIGSYFFSSNLPSDSSVKSLIYGSVAVGMLIITLLITTFERKLFSMICTPLTTLKIALKFNFVEIHHQRLYGTQAQRFYFAQIEKFKSYQKNKKLFLKLILANQEEIKFKFSTGDGKQTTKMVKKLNKIIKTKPQTNPNQ
jgi:hypothetical protein